VGIGDLGRVESRQPQDGECEALLALPLSSSISVQVPVAVDVDCGVCLCWRDGAYGADNGPQDSRAMEPEPVTGVDGMVILLFGGLVPAVGNSMRRIPYDPVCAYLRYDG
jgi:hypothetical protein